MNAQIFPACILERDWNIAQRFKALVQKKVQLQELRIFGSRARGDATKESDLDLFLVVDKLDHSCQQYISECAWEAGFEDDVVVMPIAVTLDTLKNSPIRESVFIQNIYREGVSL